MEFNSAHFGHRLKVCRTEVGMTQEDLAQASGITKASITRYELGMNVPRLDAAYALATALGCTIDELACLPAPGTRSN